MAHLALNEIDENHVAASWGEKVSDEEYAPLPQASTDPDAAAASGARTAP
jgi:hypothetical protein